MDSKNAKSPKKLPILVYIALLLFVGSVFSLVPGVVTDSENKITFGIAVIIIGLLLLLIHYVIKAAKSRE